MAKVKADNSTELRRMRKALREVEYHLSQALEGDERPTLDIVTEPYSAVDSAFAAAFKARMGPKKFKQWIKQRRRETEEAA